MTAPEGEQREGHTDEQGGPFTFVLWDVLLLGQKLLHPLWLTWIEWFCATQPPTLGICTGNFMKENISLSKLFQTIQFEPE